MLFDMQSFDQILRLHHRQQMEDVKQYRTGGGEQVLQESDCLDIDNFFSFLDGHLEKTV